MGRPRSLFGQTGRAVNDVASRAMHAQQLVASQLLDTLTRTMRAYGHQMDGEQQRGTSPTAGEYIAVRCSVCGACCAVAFDGFSRSFSAGKGEARTISRMTPPPCEFRQGAGHSGRVTRSAEA